MIYTITPITWSIRNHSNILICCSKNIYYYYVEDSWVEFFRFLWWIESSEEQHLSGIEIFCNIINVFIIIFDQFKASLLNKVLISITPPPHTHTHTHKKKIILTPSFCIMLQKLFISDKRWSLDLSIHQIIQKKKYSTVLNIDYNNNM